MTELEKIIYFDTMCNLIRLEYGREPTDEEITELQNIIDNIETTE